MNHAYPVDLVSSPWGGIFSRLLAKATEDVLYEYGLCLNDPPLVRRVRADAEGYAALGADVSREALLDLRLTANELAGLQKRVERDISPELWKHYVRTAQQHLKRRGVIAYCRGYWHRADQPVSDLEKAQAH